MKPPIALSKAHSPERVRKQGRTRLAVGLTAISLGLAVAIVWQAAPPEPALPVLRGANGDPSALLTLARRDLQTASTSAELSHVEELAERALRRAPLSARAGSLLALVSQRRGETAKTYALLSASAKLSRRDDLIDALLFHQAARRGDYTSAFLRADALLRRNPEMGDQIFVQIAPMLNDPSAVKPLAVRIATVPPWRDDFLTAVYRRARHPAAAFPLLSAMNAAGSPPTVGELSPYLERMVAEKQYEEGYLNWLLFLPESEISRITPIYDGDFNGWKTSRPFGWSFANSIGGSAEIGRIEPDRSALHVSSNGFDKALFASQLLLLTPGRYTFSGEILNQTDGAAGSVEWSFACDGQRELVAVPSVPTGGVWRSFSAVVEIPSGCPAQWLSLVGLPGDRRTTVELWYDRIKIERSGEVAQ
jgi:hypothetical protein